MDKARLIPEVILELEQKLAERGQSENAISQYHYIFRVFSSFSESLGEQHFSHETLAQCLHEHYGITDQTILARRQSYKKKVLRAYQMLCDAADGRPFAPGRAAPPGRPGGTSACRYSSNTHRWRRSPVQQPGFRPASAGACQRPPQSLGHP